MMTGGTFGKIPSSEREAILAAIHELGGRMDRRFEQMDTRISALEKDVGEIKSEMKTMGKGVLEVQLSMKHLPSYWHMYVALTGLVVTVYSLMRFAMPSH
ncbi:hypothetical protein JL101_020150 [Skermanella rosea]|uniref:hypothetical protein n=1 Tax=Skermanella rosea TaxID=1817965 RepID=UPI001933053B|nr:hypothetical protein [Skermanella rosea]UEM02296.1 hypothetical protein JL101_020150 [Skermanella rosea]